MHPFLSADAVDDLRCLAAMIIPASERFGIPAADDPAIFADLLRSLDHDRIEVEAGLAHVRAKAGRKLAEMDEPARAALADFRAVVGGGEDAATALACVFATSLGGRNLIDIGMEADLAPAAAVDALPVVPRLDRASGWVVAEPTRPA